MGAVFIETIGIEIKRMLPYGKMAFLGNDILPNLDFRIAKLLDAATLQTDDMIVVTPFVELENGFSRLEMMACNNTGGFKLSQYAIDSSQTHIFTIGKQCFVNFFGSKVSFVGCQKEVQYS